MNYKKILDDDLSSINGGYNFLNKVISIGMVFTSFLNPNGFVSAHSKLDIKGQRYAENFINSQSSRILQSKSKALNYIDKNFKNISIFVGVLLLISCAKVVKFYINKQQKNLKDLNPKKDVKMPEENNTETTKSESEPEPAKTNIIKDNPQPLVMITEIKPPDPQVNKEEDEGNISLPPFNKRMIIASEIYISAKNARLKFFEERNKLLLKMGVPLPQVECDKIKIWKSDYCDYHYRDSNIKDIYDCLSNYYDFYYCYCNKTITNFYDYLYNFNIGKDKLELFKNEKKFNDFIDKTKDLKQKFEYLEKNLNVLNQNEVEDILSSYPEVKLEKHKHYNSIENLIILYKKYKTVSEYIEQEPDIKISFLKMIEQNVAPIEKIIDFFYKSVKFFISIEKALNSHDNSPENLKKITKPLYWSYYLPSFIKKTDEFDSLEYTLNEYSNFKRRDLFINKLSKVNKKNILIYLISFYKKLSNDFSKIKKDTLLIGIASKFKQITLKVGKQLEETLNALPVKTDEEIQNKVNKIKEENKATTINGRYVPYVNNGSELKYVESQKGHLFLDKNTNEKVIIERDEIYQERKRNDSINEMFELAIKVDSPYIIKVINLTENGFVFEYVHGAKGIVRHIYTIKDDIKNLLDLFKKIVCAFENFSNNGIYFHGGEGSFLVDKYGNIKILNHYMHYNIKEPKKETAGEFNLRVVVNVAINYIFKDDKKFKKILSKKFERNEINNFNELKNFVYRFFDHESLFKM